MKRFLVLVAILAASAATLAAQTSSTPSFDLNRDAYADANNQAGGAGAYTSMVTGDFNNDGKPDLVVVGSGTSIFLRLGNGDGTFQAPTTIGALDNPYFSDMGVADVNHDGKLDLIVASYNAGANISPYQAGSGTFQVFLGNGNGTFQPSASYATSYGPYSLAVADFNGDGYPDIAIGDYAGRVELWNNQGGTSFALAKSVQSQSGYPLFVRAGEFNGDDGINHLAVLSSAGSVYIFWNDGQENFTQTYYYGNYIVPTISVGDLNQDGKDDVIIPFTCQAGNGDQSACGGIEVLYGEGNNQVTKQLAVNIPNTFGPNSNSLAPALALAVDVNGDGIGDLVAEPSASNQPDNSVTGLQVYLGEPNGSFSQTPLQYVPSTHPNGALVAADFNRDGMMDFAQTLPVTDQQIETYINGGTRASCSSYTNHSSATVCQPVDHTYLTSPVTVQANSYDQAGVTAMQEYIDNSLVYSQNVRSFTQAFRLAPGSHFLVTKAWDSTGAAYRSDRTITVYSGTPGPACGVSSVGTAAICIPATATSSSPVEIVANGWTKNVPTAAQLYIDGSLVVNHQGCDTTGNNCDGGTSWVETTQTLSSGTHDLYFKLWDNLGNVYDAQKTITVN